jgi:transposase
MRGADEEQSQIFSYLSPEARVRKDHPLRAIRAMVDEVLSEMARQFDAMYASVGRPSIAPEKLLRAQLLQMLYSIRSERLLMEEMDYNLLFRWFVGLNADDAVWDATVFTKNRDRLLEADVAKRFLAQVVEQARGPWPDIGRTLHGGRDTAGSLGGRKKFSAEGKENSAAGRSR